MKKAEPMFILTENDASMLLNRRPAARQLRIKHMGILGFQGSNVNTELVNNDPWLLEEGKAKFQQV